MIVTYLDFFDEASNNSELSSAIGIRCSTNEWKVIKMEVQNMHN